MKPQTVQTHGKAKQQQALLIWRVGLSAIRVEGVQRADTIARFRCLLLQSKRRIGKAVEFRRVPNAVRTMTPAMCHWLPKPGRRVGSNDAKPEDRPESSTRCTARQRFFYSRTGECHE